MRGTLLVMSPETKVDGIIPAHAGNTSSASFQVARSGDHPRTCGEHRWPCRGRWFRPGSSPHMRGTPDSIAMAVVSIGIIPAHAGNTARHMCATLLRWDHPRTCGEHGRTADPDGWNTGSSPHMRGTRRLWHLEEDPEGIIPAHAGNTTSQNSSPSKPEDHPRTCGEHLSCSATHLSRAGSSPHMRGTPCHVDHGASQLGIIPAHAGNTVPVPPVRVMPRDHPRTCGEHTSRLAQYRGFLIRSVCFLFSFILSTSLPAGTYWHCSIHDEEHRQKTLPSYWTAV